MSADQPDPAPVSEQLELLELQVADLAANYAEFRRLAAEMVECTAAVARVVPPYDEGLRAKLADLEAMFARIATS